MSMSNNPPAKGYPRNLSAALAKRGISQADLARAINAHPSQISRYCRGLTPSAATAARIAEVVTETRDGVAV